MPAHTKPLCAAIAVLANVSLANAQSPADPCAQSLLRGDLAAAHAAAASADDPALRARLEAALIEPGARAQALLAVAQTFADSPEADRALLAGAAALAMRQSRGEVVPELAAWLEREGDYDDETEPAVPVLVPAFARAIAARRAADGDAARLDEAQRLLDIARIARASLDPSRVAPGASWPLPERRENLQLRAWRWAPGPVAWPDLLALGEPTLTRDLPRAATTAIPGLPMGNWLVELTSSATSWRSLSMLEVAAIEAIALCDGERMVVAAHRNGRPLANGRWSPDAPTFTLGGELGDAPTLAPWPDSVPGAARALMISEGDENTWLVVASPRTQERFAPSPWLAHIALDAPLHRAGDEVQGRLVLRRASYRGDGLDAEILDTQVAAHQAVRMIAFAGSDEEITLDGATDEHGVYAFAVEIPEPFGKAQAEFRFVDPRSDPVSELATAWVAVREFVRPAVVATVTGPEVATRDAAVPTVVLQAHWASGAPAANLPVEVQTLVWSKVGHFPVESAALATDGEGRVTATLSLEHRPNAVQVWFTVALPDGTSQEFRHTVRIVEDLAAAAPDRSPPRERLTAPAEPAVVGQPVRIALHGDANDTMLVVAGRGAAARAQVVQLDAAGEGFATIVSTRAEWPWLDVTAADAYRAESLRVPLHLAPPQPPCIDLTDTARPGETVRGRVQTAPGTVVTVVVADERLYDLQPDATRDPADALRPRAPIPAWRHAANAHAQDPADLLGAMLEDGAVPLPDRPAQRRNWASSGGPAAASLAAPTRTTFRAVATFATVVADATGTADVPITLPDDLTTWRATIFAVQPDGEAFRAQRAITTRLPLALEPLLPRVLRAGDAVAMPVVVDRAATAAAAGDRAQVTIGSDATSLAVDGGERALAVPAGGARTLTVPLHASAAGKAAMSFAVTLGEHADRSRRILAIAPDAVATACVVGSVGTGEVACDAPAAIAADAGLEVTVLGGGRAAWRAIAARLEEYPYGCAEQTLSRLLPFFAAARGAREHGTPPPSRDDAFQKRLRSGMLRLRELQHGHGGFSFWTRGAIDAGITALVLHGLAVVREGGVDPREFGLGCDPTAAPFAEAIAATHRSRGAIATDEDVLAAELVAACLRYRPDHADVCAAANELVDAGSNLPPGLLARLGLAVLAAGDAGRAAACLDRLDRVAVPDALPPHGFPGEDPLAVQALRLELAHRLHRDTATLAADVLMQCLAGRGSTCATGAALAALALVLPDEARTDADTLVTVTAGETTRQVSLTAANGFAARVHMPTVARVRAAGPSGQTLLLRLTGEHRERASDHAAWQGGLVVERRLLRPRGKEFAAVDPRAVPGGERLVLRLRVAAPTTARYVVVECPLPAGFEPLGDGHGVVRFDDRIVFTIDRLDERGATFDIPVAAQLAGTVVWPPTTAAPMYASGCSGGTAGAILTVLPPAASEHPCAGTFGTAPAEPAPAAEDTGLARQLRDARRSALDALGLADPAERDQAFAAAIGTFAALAPSEPATVLDSLTGLVRSLDERLDDADGSRAAPLRTRAQLAWLDLFASVEGAFLTAPSDEDAWIAEVLTDALDVWPGSEGRERRLARVLHAAAARPISFPESWLDRFATPLADHDARSELLAALPFLSRYQVGKALNLLPPEDLASVPPPLLMRLLPNQVLTDPVIAVWLRTSAGRDELARGLEDPAFLGIYAQDLVPAMPAELWARVPLASFEQVADEVDLRDELVARLAASRFATAELQQALLTSRDPNWQAMLARALRQRGVRDLPPPPADAAPWTPFWPRAIALGATDADGAARLLRDLDLAGQQDADAIRAVALPIVAAHGDIAQIRPFAGELDEATCAALFARLNAPSRRALLATVEADLAGLPLASDREDCDAIWAYGLRRDDPWAAATALARTDQGLAFLREQIDPADATEHAQDARRAYAAELGLDADTLAPPSDAPWQPELDAARRHGFAQAFADETRQRLAHIRRLRGID